MLGSEPAAPLHQVAVRERQDAAESRQRHLREREEQRQWRDLRRHRRILCWRRLPLPRPCERAPATRDADRACRAHRDRKRQLQHVTGNRNRIALLLVLLLVGAAGVLWWADSRRLATANQSVAHTQEVSRQIELLAGNLTEMESNARGFVLGGDARLLRDARRADEDARSGVASVVRLTADNARQQQLGSMLRGAIDEKIAFNVDRGGAVDAPGVRARR
ncbi:MAG: hypothetical protein E6J61_20305 [Deltaproteobacteria bacterium]|nr:MAG: hypothetical protein E6J61_20305 [Deltaproteobacteria bacterium]